MEKSMHFRVIAIALLVASVLVFSPTANAKKGKLGFSVDTTTSGVISPTLQMVKIKNVRPGSPAEASGLKPGDRIIELDGHAVDGAPAKTLYDKLSNLQVGDHVRIKLLRGSEPVVIEIVAGG
ncbi:MAG: PDZ domain-containing protein [Arenimonas sp.]